jgi:hypothetical protein
MSTFTQYLTESVKQYDYKIKVAGDLDKGFADKLETALGKFDVVKLSAGKSYPIQETPLDFPQFKNTNVTIFDATTNYPASVFEMTEYLANYLNLAKNQIVVRKPGEPTEQYQADAKIKSKNEYASVLQDVEYSDLPKLKTDEVYGDKANASLLKELLKDKQAKFEIAKGTDNKTQDIQPKEEKGNASPLSKSTNPHPDPKRK